MALGSCMSAWLYPGNMGSKKQEKKQENKQERPKSEKSKTGIVCGEALIFDKMAEILIVSEKAPSTGTSSKTTSQATIQNNEPTIVKFHKD